MMGLMMQLEQLANDPDIAQQLSEIKRDRVMAERYRHAAESRAEISRENHAALAAYTRSVRFRNAKCA